MTDTLNLVEVAISEGLIIELDFDEDDKRLEWAPLNIANRVMPVITAAMAEDKAEIARLRAEVAHLQKVSVSRILPGLLDDDEEQALVDFIKELRAGVVTVGEHTITLEARNVTDA